MKVNKKEQQANLNARPNLTERCLASCRKLLAQIADVKSQVLTEFRDRLAGQQHLLELAVNEAEALAWQTDFPQLLFPTLAVEKATAVAGWNSRQHTLRRHAAAPVLIAA